MMVKKKDSPPTTGTTDEWKGQGQRTRKRTGNTLKTLDSNIGAWSGTANHLSSLPS